MTANIHNAVFVKSAATSGGLIHDGLPQIVFAGRSNVGKSSVINCLLGRKNFARVGQTPGKTVHINYFLIDGAAYFVDLPGYGYAKVSKSERARWSKLMDTYFTGAGRIALGVLIVDARHKPTGDDVIMAQWFKSSRCRLVVAANKADKVKSSEKESKLAIIRETLDLEDGTGLIPFSAVKGHNREALLAETLSAVEQASRGGIAGAGEGAHDDADIQESRLVGADGGTHLGDTGPDLHHVP
ncbi:MAG: ribosome biogenesis GTP-binding protein YihA/YsxC [Oscillospiraceae bacterium]|nr:ribosome biogenesis GTP-binding protein YihA/YsxC [Oscillospiraceae bacterium]